VGKPVIEYPPPVPVVADPYAPVVFLVADTQIPDSAVPELSVTVPVIVPPGCMTASIPDVVDPAVTDTAVADEYDTWPS